MFSQLNIMHKLGRDNFSLGLKLLNATTSISQAITEEAADYTRNVLRQSASACEKLADAKTIDARLDIQRDYGKAALDELLAHAEKIGDLYLTLAKEGEFLKPALQDDAVDPRGAGAVEETASKNGNASTIAVAAHPIRPTEKSVVRGIVASAVRETAEALRHVSPTSSAAYDRT